MEWSRWARGVTPSDFRAPVGVAVDGDVAVAAASPGEGGWAVTAYRKRNGRWAAVREHPAAPAHCLFAHDAISADREAALFATVLAVAPVNRVYPDDRVMTMNAATDRIPCQDPN
ncbi:MAG TPA: hypothetical protein VHT05_12855 [Candidatus Elarobacter sp.]|nr:hypothetical protein [Candidatus Elarobacter sp.]